MSTIQIVAIIAVALVAAWNFFPIASIRLPVIGKASIVSRIQSVIDIRESSEDPIVKDACNVLLKAMLDAK